MAPVVIDPKNTHRADLKNSRVGTGSSAPKVRDPCDKGPDVKKTVVCTNLSALKTYLSPASDNSEPSYKGGRRSLTVKPGVNASGPKFATGADFVIGKTDATKKHCGKLEVARC